LWLLLTPLLQLYPANAAQGAAAVAAATRGGWASAQLLVAFPHSKNLRKWFLVCGSSPLASDADKVCPLAYPYDARCALCNASGGEGGGETGGGGAAAAGAGTGAGAAASDEALLLRHVRFSGKLVRIHRRLQLARQVEPAAQPMQVGAIERPHVESGLAAALAQLLTGSEGAERTGSAGEIEAISPHEEAKARWAEVEPLLHRRY